MSLKYKSAGKEASPCRRFAVCPFDREEEEEEEEGLFKAVNEVDAESDGDASVGGDEIRR